MDNDLENIQHLNGNTYQCSAYKDEFILAEIELKMGRGKEVARRKKENLENGGQTLKYMGRPLSPIILRSIIIVLCGLIKLILCNTLAFYFLIFLVYFCLFA